MDAFCKLVELFAAADANKNDMFTVARPHCG